MHKIEIEVIDAAELKLALEEGADIRLLIEVGGGELIRERIRLAGIAARNAAFDRLLALAAEISVGGVKVIKARLDKSVCHLNKFLVPDLAAIHRKTHTAEAEVLFNLLKILFHSGQLLH